ncbi:MAG: DUF371 domain-containing protein [Methanobrevibacter arboriphilus]|uniref:DUF371 domain-containing protein n=1 Tax=Methanobrevibacter arboriphilus TaxID=39441 RepID=A0A843ACE2_METAZ|nr:DUF371 domain-containing protein [Methanobrevibacter arboriphilus]MBF4468632.1 DUF371 domain-containing protein [Methanobrevibacter arboriphilus]
MNFIIQAKGHENVTSKHKSTFEITKDKNLSMTGDCIIGVDMDKTMDDFPEELKEKIANENTKIKVKLSTDNSNDEINGFGHPRLTLNHPTDIVSRKSNYVCSRTLMIKSDKASSDLNKNLINDLKEGKSLRFEIII